MKAENKVVLVTGSSRGIGKSIALAFGKNNFNVVVNFKKNIDMATKVVKEITKSGGSAFYYCADITKPEEVNRMIDRIILAHGRIDVLINNAGIHDDNVIWNMSDYVWDRVLNVNLTGAFYCMRTAIKHMREQGYGRIINISSVVGQVGIAGTSNYSSSKAGLFGLTKAVAKEVARSCITVNALTLGYFDSGMFNRLSKEIQADIISRIPMGRVGTVKEVTDTILFLCSESAGYITGQTIHLNGGYYM